MGRNSETGKLGQHGPYWLTQQPKSPYWHLTWYEKTKRQTVHESLGTADFKEADAAVTLHYLRTIQEDEPLTQDEFTLYNALDFYWAEHVAPEEGTHLPSEESARVAIRFWKAFFRDDVTLKELGDLKLQDRFIAHLRKTVRVNGKKGERLSEGYISRILSVARSALKYCQTNNKVALVPFIRDNETKAQKKKKQPKGRPLGLEELARLFLSTEAQHLKDFMTVMVNTLCRPDAAFDLAPKQVDWEYDTVNLNPEEREQTKKYRPIVPVTKALKPLLKKCSAPKIINYRGKGVAEIDTAWKKMVMNSGINPIRVNPYSIRHTMGRVLRAAKIKGEEISIYLGHKPVDENDVTTIYSPYDPTYLRDAAKAIDGYWARLQAEIARQAKTFKPRKNCPGKRNDLKKAA